MRKWTVAPREYLLKHLSKIRNGNRNEKLCLKLWTLLNQVIIKKLSFRRNTHRLNELLVCCCRNFASWARSLRLYVGGKGKSGWILGTEKRPDIKDPKYAQWDMDNCTILGWMFNSMEERIYNIFMFYDSVNDLWTTLNQMYAHSRNDARIFELYQDIAKASQEGLNLSVTDCFGYLRSRWEELAQYEPLSEFPSEAASLLVKRLDRQHTYQFLMGLHPEFEPLKSQILNASPMPSLLEAFATVDGEARRHRLIQPSIVPVPMSESVGDSMAFAANFGSRASGGQIICHHCGGVGHVKARCFKLHPELKQKLSRNRLSRTGFSRTAAVAETPVTTGGSTVFPGLSQLQSQIGQIQDQLSSLASRVSAPSTTPTATIATVFSSNVIPVTQSVYLADGSTSYIHSKGDVCLSPDIILSSVLHDLCSKRIFGRGYERDRLYYFGEPPGTSLQASALPTYSVYDVSFRTFSLWHARLGHFLQMIKTQYNTVVRNIRSDNGREYVSNEFWSELEKKGILHQLPGPYIPEQNGVAERKNCHLMSVVRCLLSGMHVPKFYWHMAVLTATFLINRTPSRVLGGKAPLQILHPDYTLFHLLPRVFCCTCFVHNRSPSRHKLDDKSIRCIFLGYSAMSKGYRFYDPVTKHMYHSLYVTFHETIPFYSTNSVVYSLRHRTQPPLPESSSEPGLGNSPSPIAPTIPEHTSRYPTRDRHPPNWYGFSSSTNHPISQYVSYDGLSGAYKSFLGKIGTVSIPRSVSEAFQDPNWVSAMTTEMDALHHNNTWELVALPSGEKTVGCKWVFNVKYLADGSIDQYKARLVAKGFTQIPGKDFSATFAPVAKLTSVRLLVSLSAAHSWLLHQLDVKNAFFNGDLLETIYGSTPWISG
ncbi:uncharacterized protein LOC132316698 [Cornus florida]|uniref:uncharacterized protein LOC132316698 n=1 Tax=Cornus florida TaxID=4283 RepID=UPI00289CFA97|nr:uncharacterized protein LOC132316698 [Cornus florida]